MLCLPTKHTGAFKKWQVVFKVKRRFGNFAASSVLCTDIRAHLVKLYQADPYLETQGHQRYFFLWTENCFDDRSVLWSRWTWFSASQHSLSALRCRRAHPSWMWVDWRKYHRAVCHSLSTVTFFFARDDCFFVVSKRMKLLPDNNLKLVFTKMVR